ncbi:MAG TPA: preprotein translocase subunit SecE [Clostridiales bacterium]|nr:preprotein translocase subunit SecE [Clostridiales bacterium]HQP68791.1 preprotein translocase subunit SecE [Clostridiales bacterium]
MNSIIEFFRSTVKEMKLVSWPSKPEVWGSTKVVIGITILLVLFIFGSDQLLNWLIGIFIN